MNSSVSMSVKLTDQIFNFCKGIIKLEQEVIVGHEESVGFSSSDEKFNLQYIEMNDNISKLSFSNKEKNNLFDLNITKFNDDYTLYEYDLMIDGEKVKYDENLIYLVKIYHAVGSYFVMLKKAKSLIPKFKDDVDEFVTENNSQLIKKRGKYE